jgi:hypothetical protein
MEKYCIDSRRRGISYVTLKEIRLSVLVISCVEPTLFKEIQKAGDEEEDVSSYWVTRKRENSGSWNRKN